MENKTTGKGRGRGRVSAQEARERAQQHLGGGTGQTASDGKAPTRGAATGGTATRGAATGGGRSRKAAGGETATRGTGTGGRGRQSAAQDSTATRGKGTGGGRGQRAANGPQRGENDGNGNGKTSGTGTNNAAPKDVNGVLIETVPVPGRGGRQMSAEKYPFAALTPAVKQADGSMVGPSFLIPANSDDKPENVLAAARKRHTGKTFISRKVDGGVRVWLQP